MAKIKNPFNKIPYTDLISLVEEDEAIIVGVRVVTYNHPEDRQAFKSLFSPSITDKGVGTSQGGIFKEAGTGRVYKEKYLTYLKAFLYVDIRPNNLIQRVLYGTRTISIELGSDDFDDIKNEDFEVDTNYITNFYGYLFQEHRDLSSLEEFQQHNINLID